MTYVVTDACIKCKYTDCVEVCPTDAFREGPNFLAIEPADCIDCTLCVPECPVDAIYADSDVPDEFRPFMELNVTLAARWPVIIAKKAPLTDADEWAKVKGKLPLLDPGPVQGDS
jgi:ferredoxin